MKRFYLITASVLLAFISNAQLVSTWIGSGTQGSTTGTARLSTQLDRPWGCAIDGQGNIWMAEEGGNVIKMLLPGGTVYSRAGTYGNAGFYNAAGANAHFDGPHGIAAGPGDTLFIADYNNCVIRKMNPFLSLSNAQTVTVLAGKYTNGSSSSYTPQPGFANGGPTVAQFNYPTDVAVDGNGNVYVADAGNHAIRKITRAGMVTTITGGPTMQGYVDGTLAQAKFNLPTGLFLASNGDLYVADKGNSKIRKISISGDSVTTVVSGLYTPSDVIFTNNIYYITDQHRIRKYANSTLTTFAGSNTLNDYGNVNAYGTNARFYNVQGLFLNANDGYIYVADQDNHLIKRVSICTITTPSITATGNDTLCQGDSVVLAGPAGYFKYQWNNGKTTQSITVKTAGSYTLSVTSTDSCVNISNPFVVTLLNVSSKITYTTPTAFCNGDSIILKGPAGYTGYSWSNGATTQNITLKTSDTVTLTVNNHWCSSTSQPVRVRVKPVPTSTFSCKDTVCLNTNCTITYTGSAATTATYTWNFGGGQIISGSKNGPYTIKWATTGIKTVTCSVKDTNACQSVVTSKTIRVLPLPTSTFTVQTPLCALANDTITYTGNGTSKCTYAWVFDTAIVSNGSGMGPYTVYWADSGTKSVTLIVTDTNGCVSSKSSKSVMVNKTSTSTFIAKQLSVLINATDSITYTGNGGTYAHYYWDFDSAATQAGSGKGPYRVSWNTKGIKTITLTVIENGCSSTFSLQINVSLTGSKPVPDFSANVTTINQGQSVHFTDNSLNNPTSWKWTFTGGNPVSSTTANQTVTYNTAGSFNVKLVVANSYGKDSLTKTGYIKVNSLKPVVDFNASVTTITQGGSVTFTDASTYIPSSWKWTFQGGTPATATTSGKVVQYNTAGTYYVKLVASNSYGSDSLTKNAYITVNTAGQKPVADFSASKTVIKIGESIKFTDLSTNSPVGLVWSFQGGSPSTSVLSSPIIAYNSAGTYDVQLIAINAAGSDTAIKSKYILVNPLGIDTRNNDPSIRFYPSPVKDKLIIETVSDLKNSTIEVLDITGKIKYVSKYSVSGKSISLDLTTLPRGLYLLRIGSGKVNFIGKFSKE